MSTRPSNDHVLVPPMGGASYDPEADALYVRFTEAPHGSTIEPEAGYFVHLDVFGHPYAVERLDVRHGAEQLLAKIDAGEVSVPSTRA